jgi:hypothetical protein
VHRRSRQHRGEAEVAGDGGPDVQVEVRSRDGRCIHCRTGSALSDGPEVLVENGCRIEVMEMS